MREAKAQTVLSLARDTNDNRKGFYRFVASKGKTKDNMGPLHEEMGDLATMDKEKVEVLNHVCASIFNSHMPQSCCPS